MQMKTIVEMRVNEIPNVNVVAGDLHARRLQRWYLNTTNTRLQRRLVASSYRQ